jgi:Skp family chaperone for outer membrane proteins
MKIRNAPIAAIAVLTLALQASAASAQPAAAAAAAAPVQVIPGLCAFSNTRVAVGSKVGKYVMGRVDTIAQQTNAELNGVRTTLQTDAQAVDGQRATLPQDQYETKQLELRQRADALQRLIQQRQREVELTENKALERISKEVEPLINVARQERNCSIILDADAVIMVHQSMDLTDSVVQKLDAKITEFAFDRERMENQQQAQGAPAGAGVAPRPATAAPRPAAAPATPAGPARRPSGSR